MTDEEKQAQLDVETYYDDLRALSSTDAGKRFFVYLLHQTGCLRAITKTNAEVYKLAGVQAFGLRLWRDLHAASPDASLDIFDSLMTPEEHQEEELT